MIKFDTDVKLSSGGVIPIELVKASSDWYEILLNNLPFIVTISIISFAAYVNYKSNRKSVASQESIATKARNEEHENKISEFRHLWIQDVRDTVSTLCRILHDLQFQTALRNQAIKNEKEAIQNNDEENSVIFEEQANKSYKKIVEKRSEYYQVSTKLKLYFKKADPSTAAVFKIINDIKNEIYEIDKIDMKDSKVESVTSHFQEILKKEWEVTKDRSWHRNT
tara:strand:+ start:5918 stop:6586 length:669 start_codon:yes stop_codon:yes gene_type:complete